MNELEIAKNALEQIIGYYRRSHKHGENTCYMMCLEAERALREMSLLTQRALDSALPLGHSGSSLECMHPFCVAERETPSQ
jgi:hypothetical protein